MAIRVGLIGFGLAGETFHAPLISAIPDLALAAIVTNNPDRRMSASRQYPDARLLESVEELWRASSDFDLIVVASPNGKHVEHARGAIDAGLSVVIDKPFAGTATEGQALIDAATNRGVIVVPFHNRRWDGDFLTLRSLIDAGKLGAVIRFESRFERWRVVPKPRWMAPNAPAIGEGMLPDLHTHLIDQALVLFGPVKEVYAETDKRRAGVQVEDEAFVALTHASGVRSHLEATIIAADIGPRYRVYGDAGAYVKFGVDPQEEMLKAGRRPGRAGFGEEVETQWGSLSDGASSVKVPTLPGEYTSFYAGVAKALRGGTPPVDPADAVAGLATIDAAYRSAAEKRVVLL
jgi:scyllo-inositol 2-dehydrogenase (NADP+)